MCWTKLKGLISMKATLSLSELRKTKGISQEELTEQLGVARQTIGRWEHGEFSPSAENLRKLSQVFDIPAGVLFKGGPLPLETAEAPPPDVPAEETPAPVEISASRPKHRRLWLLVAALLLAAGIGVGALFLWGRHVKTVPSSQLERSVIDDSMIGDSIELFPLE